MESQLSISWCVMKFVDPHEDEGRRCHTMRLVARNCQATGTGTWDLGPGTWDLDLGPGTWDLGPGTWDLGPGTWDLGPRT